MSARLPRTKAHLRTGGGSPSMTLRRSARGLNREAKTFSLTNKPFPSLFGPSENHLHAASFDGFTSGRPCSLSSLSSHAPSSSLSTASSLSIPPSLVHHCPADTDNVFSSVSTRAFAPSPAEREALQRAFRGSANTSLECRPTLSEVSSIPSMTPMPTSPAHTHAQVTSVSSSFRLGAGAGVGAGKKSAMELGSRRTILPPALAWLQSLPRVRKPTFSHWEGG
ncbi:hypothetical protein OH77DRAFT_1592506 [Trametes cingulata]|nr:hypothetical protein OH77DRAFT_1592506 [Trametes cingulata]